MPDFENPLRQQIPQDAMLARLAQSEQMREFFVQMWLQNPEMARRAGRRVQDMISPLLLKDGAHKRREPEPD